MGALKDVIDYAITKMEQGTCVNVIMQGKEDEFIAITQNDISYAESEGWKFYGTVEELTA